MSEEKKYPCAECSTLRTAAEGGTTFTICDTCWAKRNLIEKPKAPTSSGSDELAGSITPEFLKAVRYALWWVQDGLDSADLNNREYRRTLRCRNALKQFLGDK